MKSDQSRDTKQGVIGAYVDGKAATMLEVREREPFMHFKGVANCGFNFRLTVKLIL